MAKKLKKYAETLKKNLKDPDVQKSIKQGFAIATGSVPVKKGSKMDKAIKGAGRGMSKALKEAGRRGAVGAGMMAGKKAAEAMKKGGKSGAKGAGKKMGKRMMMGGMEMVLDRGRWKEARNKGSISEKKGKK